MKKCIVLPIAVMITIAVAGCGSNEQGTNSQVLDDHQEETEQVSSSVAAEEDKTVEETVEEAISEASVNEEPVDVSEDIEPETDSDQGAFGNHEYFVEFNKNEDGTCTGQIADFIKLDASEILSHGETNYRGVESDPYVQIKPGDIIHGDGVFCSKETEFEVVSAQETYDWYMERLEPPVEYRDGEWQMYSFSQAVRMYEPLLPVGIKTAEDYYYFIDSDLWAVNPNGQVYNNTHLADWARYGRINYRDIEFTFAADAKGVNIMFLEQKESGWSPRYVDSDFFISIPEKNPSKVDWNDEAAVKAFRESPDFFEYDGVEYIAPYWEQLWAAAKFNSNGECVDMELLCAGD